jgi:hypothetical protein
VFGRAFGVFRIGGALVHVWKIGWCLEVWRLEHKRCILSAYFEIVSVDFNWLSEFVHH